MRTRKVSKSRKHLRNIGLKSGTYMCTEDNLPVYNIELCNLSKNITEPLVVKHFGKFGVIQKVKIEYGKTRSRTIKCTVCYKNPSAATAALKQTSHTMNHNVVSVKPCASWEQTFLQQTSVVRKGTPAAQRNEGIPMLTLNDYCLEKIYQHLDLRQQLRLTLCHERLENVFVRMICSRKIRKIRLDDLRSFTVWEIRQFFKTGGQFLQRIEMSGSDSQSKEKENIIDHFMGEFCNNVESIQIVRRHYAFNFLKILNANNITELELFECYLYESGLTHLRLLRNLKTLGLACNRKITGRGLCQLRSLQQLSLYGCSRVTQANLIKICRFLPLRYLDVRNIYGITNWSAITESCKLLETLKVSDIGFHDHHGAQSIARLPKLRKLEMVFCKTAMPSSFYDALITHHSEDLEELKFTGDIYISYPTVRDNISRFKRLSVLWMGNNEYNSSRELLKNIETLKELQELNLNYSRRIKGIHVLRLLKHCPKLKCLSLRYCRKISNDFILRAITILENLRTLTTKPNQPSTPLLLLVGRTGVKRDILKNSRYINAKHLLRISFHLDCCKNGFLTEQSEFALVNENCTDSEMDNDIADDSENDSMSHSFIDMSSDDDLEELT